MDYFHKDFLGFKETFKEESQRMAELLVILDTVITDYNLENIDLDTKTLFDMVIEMRYGAERAHKFKVVGEEDESLRFLDLFNSPSFLEHIDATVKEAVVSALNKKEEGSEE
jgi:hypothetical protein